MIQQCIERKNDNQPIFLIGSNGVGKTYNLLQIHQMNATKNIYISEDGELDSRTFKNKVKIDLGNRVYIFESDERQRGKKEVTNVSKSVNINSNLIELLEFCSTELNNVKKIKKKSKGQAKILNILEIMTSIFLNSVSIILFDEPENFLDDVYLRMVANLFILLRKSGIKVVVATHNPRLCYLCEVSIDNIIIMDIKNYDGKIKYVQLNLTMDETKKIYKRISCEIKRIAREKKYNEDSGILGKLNIYEKNTLFDDLLNHMLQTEEFYRTLFYKDILLVEGETEKVILKKVYKRISNNFYFYVANGKSYLPFLVEIFTKLNKKIKVVLDSDRKPDKVESTAVAITDYFELNYNNNCKIFEYDLESNFRYRFGEI